MDQKIYLNYPSRFALLLCLLGLGIIVGNTVVLAIGSLMLHVPMSQVPALISGSAHVGAARFLNTLASFLVFCLPAVVLARVLQKDAFGYLGFSTRMSSRQLLLIVMIAMVGLLLSGALGELNQMLPLPAKWLAKAKEMEAKYKDSMMGMATMKTGADYLITLVVMAAAPAIFEEILFRGGFQPIFIGWTKNAFAGILLSSVIFSVFHFSFFGFIPRTVLGLILGYVFYYSRNLWLNILVHLIYNGMIVTQLWIATRNGKSIDKAMDESMPIWLGVFALVGMVILMKNFKNESVHQWAKNQDLPPTQDSETAADNIV